MTRNSLRPGMLAVVFVGCVLMACSPMKQPAEAALADAKAALEKVGPDAQKYAPADYATLNDEVTAMKKAFDAKDYEAVLNMVRKMAPNLRLIAETVASKRHEAAIAMKADWTRMSDDLPKSVTAVEARVTELGKAHRLPKGVTKEAVAGAGASIDAAKQAWSEAQSAHSSGNLEDAVAKAKAADAKLADLRASLAMDAPATAAK